MSAGIAIRLITDEKKARRQHARLQRKGNHRPVESARPRSETETSEQGLIRACSYCKRVQLDGRWQHTDVDPDRLTHGLCGGDDCVSRALGGDEQLIAAFRLDCGALVIEAADEPTGGSDHADAGGHAALTPSAVPARTEPTTPARPSARQPFPGPAPAFDTASSSLATDAGAPSVRRELSVNTNENGAAGATPSTQH